ncbi:MAG: TetR/AcrR family transcriptional regulator [Polyangiales bacterium]
MARPRTIDREHLLDVAEGIVAGASAATLSFGNLAAAAGVPKASVQSAFGTREALIDAMLDRWLAKEQQRFDAVAGQARSLRARVRAHIQTLADEPRETSSRMAGFLAALVGSGEQSESTARWYHARIGDLSAKTREQRRLRIAFLAAEGAFYVRHLAGVELRDATWREIFSDLLAFVE